MSPIRAVGESIDLMTHLQKSVAKKLKWSWMKPDVIPVNIGDILEERV